MFEINNKDIAKNINSGIKNEKLKNWKHNSYSLNACEITKLPLIQKTSLGALKYKG